MRRTFLLLLFCVMPAVTAAAQPYSGPGTATVTAEAAQERLAQLSLKEKVGQLFMAAFRQEDNQPVRRVTPRIGAILQQYHLGGVILFSENFQSVAQTIALNRELAAMAGPIPLWLAVDQEGGRVNRFSFGAALPGNMAVGASDKSEDSYETGYILGREMKALGINLALAPVLDVNSNQENPVIGVRSFGADPQKVSLLGKAYIEGLHDGGVMAVIKHFPGHGDTFIDSHVGLPVVAKDWQALAAVELKPFIDNFACADMVMVGHIAFPSLDSTGLPASLSQRITTKLLRGELGYQGVVITDALEMKAVTKQFGAKQAALMALQAGADILLMPENLPEAYEEILAAVKSGRVSEARIDESVRRILALKQKLPANGVVSQSEAEKIVGSVADQNAAERIAANAVTLVKNEGPLVPLQLIGHEKILLAAPTEATLALLREAAQAQCRASGSESIQLTSLLYQEASPLTGEQKQKVVAADIVIMALGREERGATALAAYGAQAGKCIIGLAVATPYNIKTLPYLSSYLAVYGNNVSNIRAGMAAVFGELQPQGRLPVPISVKNLTRAAGKE